MSKKVIYTANNYTSLTNGKEYEVLNDLGSVLTIINDNGDASNYNKDCFSPVFDAREVIGRGLCVDASGMQGVDKKYSILTQDKEYDLMKSAQPGRYSVIQDNGEIGEFNKERFKIMDDKKEALNTERLVMATVKGGLGLTFKKVYKVLGENDERSQFLINDDVGEKDLYPKKDFDDVKVIDKALSKTGGHIDLNNPSQVITKGVVYDVIGIREAGKNDRDLIEIICDDKIVRPVPRENFTLHSDLKASGQWSDAMESAIKFAAKRKEMFALADEIISREETLTRQGGRNYGKTAEMISKSAGASLEQFSKVMKGVKSLGLDFGPGEDNGIEMKHGTIDEALNFGKKLEEEILDGDRGHDKVFIDDAKETLSQDKPVDYSLFIQYPSPDLQADPEFMKGKEILSINLAIKEIENLECSRGYIFKSGLGITLPIHIVRVLISAIKKGSYRVELLDGETQYKLYRKFRSNE